MVGNLKMSHRHDEIIYASHDFQSLKGRLSRVSKKEKGDIFELFTKYFLLSHPEYKSTLKRAGSLVN